MATYSLVFSLRLNGYSGIDRTSKQERTLSCVPSWNDVLSLEQWGQNKLKQNIQAAFLSELRASGNDSSTTTTSAVNTRSILCDTLVRCLEIHQQLRELKRVSKKQEKAKKNTPSSKSSSAPTDDLRIIPHGNQYYVAKLIGPKSYETIRKATFDDMQTIPRI